MMLTSMLAKILTWQIMKLKQNFKNVLVSWGFGDIHFQFKYSTNTGSDKIKKQTQQMNTSFHPYDGMSNKKFPNFF